jgi:hypothetical protein
MKEPKLKFTYIGLDGHSIDFDFIRLLELTEATKDAFAYQYKQNKTLDDYHVTYCERKEDIPEGCEEIDFNNMKSVVN